MTITQINNIFDSADRYNVLVIQTDINSKTGCLLELKSFDIPIVNIGYEIAIHLEQQQDYSFLEIDTYDFCNKLLDRRKNQIKNMEIPVVAIHNIGILTEPVLSIKIASLIRDFSKTTRLIIVWEYEILNSHTLSWKTSNPSFTIDLNKTAFKHIKYEI